MQEFVPVPPPTIVLTVPVLDDKTVDVLTATLRAQGYDKIYIENVTRITASRPAADE